ncbi:MAG: hypothetical protein AMXMBFR67_35200 [Nitrospira sp.]
MATVFTRHNRQSLYVRIFVPAELKPLLGRSEIWKSLDTSDQAIGELRSKIVAGKASALFLRIAQHGHCMTLAQIRGLVSRYIGERLDEWEEAIATSDLNTKVNGEWQDALSGFAQSTVEDCSKALRENDPHALSQETLKEFLSRYGITGIPEGSRAHRILCRELLKAEQVIASRMKVMVQGQYEDAYAHPQVVMRNGSGEGPATLISPTRREPAGPLLSLCVRDYLKHFEHRAPGTLEAKRNMLKRFLELIGDKPVGSLGKHDCIAYRDTARKLPSNASKKFPGLSLKAVLERAKGLPEGELLSKQTINQDLTHLGHFFSWLINEGRYTGSVNPVDGIAYEGIESKSHEAFSDDDIKLVFGSSEFKRQKADKKYSARYWIPLILLHTGARREEIANLALADIRQEEGVHFFDITPDLARGRRLKNKSSKRRVPIHLRLISLGFLDYVEKRRSEGETLVFSKKSSGKGRATVGDSVSKWFHRLLKHLTVKGSKSLHGLRPTVATKLHEAGVDGETRRELLGHSGKDVHETVYLRLSLKTLKESLEKLELRF